MFHTIGESARKDAHNLDDLRLRHELRRDFSSAEALAERQRFALPTPEWVEKIVAQYAKPKEVDKQ